ncbi:MAG: ATP-dependent Clp protease proteolytic subunit [Elusimicrobia bacterium]|nr:ATP-dependent Clp protease proteolytic subunit [Elusimicrobiota bacterium]
MPMIIPTVIERWNQGAAAGYDIYSRLLKDRIIFVGGYEGVVTTDSANLLIAQLLYLQSEDPDKEIQIFINSPGGMVTAGLAVYDTMRYVTTPITTICMGMAMSFGAVLLASGTKGRRYVLPHARVMIHQPLISGGGIGGQATDIEIENKELQVNKDKLIQILAHHTGQKPDKLRSDMERNYYMSAEEAKSYGIVDEIITTRKHK